MNLDVLTAVVHSQLPETSSMSLSSRIAFIMPGLKSRCEAFLLNDVSAHNVSERLKTAYELQPMGLLIVFILLNW
ncbi:unnamed protein product, partial [Mesorhabditis belari]|uniref:Uncharacterized protein n=1 Tax=Mesorhabditis belari TaxID=2138241 RepID=A0AAF3F5P8_9BILA